MQGTAGPTSAQQPWWWIFDPRCSLRARAALLVGIGMVTLTLLLAWSTGTIFRRALENHLATTFETLAFQVGDKLDRAVYERYRTLQIAASLGVIRNPASSPTERRRVFEILQETSTEFAWIGLTDPSGKIVVATNQLFEGTNAEPRQWFRVGREQPFVGPLREIPELARDGEAADADIANRFLDIAVPVTDSNGQFGGVLAAHIRWSWSRDVQASVVSEVSARERVGVTVYGPGRDVLLDSGASGWTQPLDAPAVGENRRFRGSIFETTAGTVYLSGYSRSRGFREYRGLGWLTVVRQPVQRAFAAAATLRRSIVIWGCLLTAASIAAAWILAGRHARRLRIVRAAAERIREGDILAVLPRPKGPSEIATMCGALNDLVEDLRAKEETLTAENARLAARLRERESAER